MQPSLLLTGQLLDTKKFRDSLLKLLQYGSKFILHQTDPNSPVQAPVKKFADHLSVGRKLYRWGTFIENLSKCLLLLEKIEINISFSLTFTIALFTFISNLFDAISYCQSVLGQPKSRADRLCALFYVLGLTLSLVKTSRTLIAFETDRKKAAENGQSASDARRHFVFESTKAVSNIVTATNTAFPSIQFGCNMVALSGVVAGYLGMQQNYCELKQKGQKKPTNNSTEIVG